MKHDKIRISQSEWEVMEVLWHQSPLSATEIFEKLGPKTTWNIKTVRAFLDRLEQKNVIRKEKAHGINVFKPVPKREHCLRQESSSFLDRFFRGNPVSMMTHFIEREELSKDEIRRLRHLLDNKHPTDEK